MNIKKIISTLIITTLLISVSFTLTLAGSEQCSISCDDGYIRIIYTNPAYRNSQVSIVVTDNATGENVYIQQYTLSDSGAVYPGSIALAKGGEYTVSVFPEFRPGAICEVIEYFSGEDKAKLWEIASVGTDSDELSENWNYIGRILGINTANLEYVTDYELFFSKAVSLRGEDLSEMNSQNKIKLEEYFSNIAIYTALEKSTDLTGLSELFESIDSALTAENEEVRNAWFEIIADDESEELLKIFAGKEKEISSYTGLTEVMEEVIADYNLIGIFDKIENADHVSEISRIISDEKNAGLLGIEEYLDSYTSLKDTTPVDKKLISVRFDSVSDFQEKFSDALREAESDAEASTSEKPVRPSSGGGGGGIIAMPSHTAPSSEGSDVTVNSEENILSEPFDDLEGFPWAKEHIEKLYDMGIVSGKAQRSFAPSDSIKREEIAKLIAGIFGLEKADKTIGFDDVPPDAWYREYVEILSSCGIVKGVGDNLFGTGLDATREDIAVMLVNALEYYGCTFTNDSNTAFADREEISDYALSAVSALSREKIIMGDDLGRFNPQSCATRAEVAVMISRVYSRFITEGR